MSGNQKLIKMKLNILRLTRNVDQEIESNCGEIEHLLTNWTKQMKTEEKILKSDFKKAQEIFQENDAATAKLKKEIIEHERKISAQSKALVQIRKKVKSVRQKSEAMHAEMEACKAKLEGPEKLIVQKIENLDAVDLKRVLELYHDWLGLSMNAVENDMFIQFTRVSPENPDQEYKIVLRKLKKSFKPISDPQIEVPKSYLNKLANNFDDQSKNRDIWKVFLHYCRTQFRSM